jgi:hypothetical protein
VDSTPNEDDNTDGLELNAEETEPDATVPFGLDADEPPLPYYCATLAPVEGRVSEIWPNHPTWADEAALEFFRKTFRIASIWWVLRRGAASFSWGFSITKRRLWPLLRRRISSTLI